MDNPFEKQPLHIVVLDQKLMPSYVVLGSGKYAEKTGSAQVRTGGDIDPFAFGMAPSTHKTIAKVVSDAQITVFPQDSIMDLRRKLARATKIPIYCQHICTEEFEQIGYELFVDSQILVSISDMLTGHEISSRHRSERRELDSAQRDAAVMRPDETLAGFGREGIRVTQHEEMTLQHLQSIHGNRFFLADLRIWLTEHELAKCRGDAGYLDLVYYGFVIKYWPIMTYDAFAAYCRDSISQFSELTSRYNYSDQSAKLYSMYHLGKSLQLVQSKHITLAVRSASVVMHGTVNLNLRNLFEFLHASPEYPFVWYQWGTRRPLKVARSVDNRNEELYERMKSKLKHGVVVYVGGNRGADILLTFTSTGYTVTGTWTETVTLDNAIKLLKTAAEPLIVQINSASRDVFTSQLRLTYIQKWMHLAGVELQLIFTHTITTAQYAAMTALLESDVGDRLINYYDGQWWFTKGVYYEPMTDPPQNGYMYLTDLGAREAYQASRRGLLMDFAHRTTSLTATVYGLSRHDLPYWYSYVLFLMERLLVAKPIGTSTTAIGLKSLKDRDPELYNPRFGKHIVYSRICQKPHQPRAYSVVEYEGLSGAERKRSVKYHNFTTSEVMWYNCPTTKYPHMTFITGKHPKGYCLPCCKKSQQNVEAHMRCLTDHTYSVEATVESRYIMNYGRPINPGRLGRLPDALEKRLMYDSLSVDAVVAVPNRRGRPPIGTSTRTSHYIYGVDGTALGAVAHALGTSAHKYIAAIYAGLRDEGHPAAAELQRKYIQRMDVISDVDFDRLFLESVRFFSLQTIVLNGEPLTIERIHDTQDPILLIFTRPRRITTFGTLLDYYPIYQINNFAYFRDQSIDKRIYSLLAPELPDENQALAYRFANIIMRFSAPDSGKFSMYQLVDMLRGSQYQVTAQLVNDSGLCYGARVALGSTVFYVPLLYHTAGGLPQLQRFSRKSCGSRQQLIVLLAALGGKLSLGRNVVYAPGAAASGIVIGAECLYQDQYVGYIYYSGDKVRVSSDDIVLMYDPDTINADNLEPNAKLARCMKSAVENEYRDQVMVPIMSLLDSERDPAIRKLIGTPQKLLQHLHDADLYDDYDFVFDTLRSGYYADQQREILGEHIYQFDRKSMLGGKLHDAASIVALMRRAKIAAENIKKYSDVLLQDFTNPIKRNYFNRGIYAVQNTAQWRFSVRANERFVLL